MSGFGPFQIRPLALGEASILRETRLRALADSPDSFRETLAEVEVFRDDDWARLVDPVAEHRDYELLVAEDGDERIGMVFVRVDQEHVAHIGAMWVDPNARGRGIGRALLDEALDFARERHAAMAELWAPAASKAAIALYEAVGFSRTGKSSTLRPGSDVPVVQMRNILS